MAKITLSDLLQNLYGVKTSAIENPVIAAVGVTAVNILQNNPNRVSFIIVNLSANAVYVGLTPGVSATNGIYIAPNGGLIQLQWDRDFEMVARAWYALAAGAASSIYVLENVIQ